MLDQVPHFQSGFPLVCSLLSNLSFGGRLLLSSRSMASSHAHVYIDANGCSKRYVWLDLRRCNLSRLWVASKTCRRC